MKTFYVYILSNKKNGILYTGVTNDLIKRVFQHKIKAVPGFTKKYGLSKLVYYELWPTALESFMREKRLKKWKRSWKIELIKNMNPSWKDLYFEITSM